MNFSVVTIFDETDSALDKTTYASWKEDVFPGKVSCVFFLKDGLSNVHPTEIDHFLVPPTNVFRDLDIASHPSHFH